MIGQRNVAAEKAQQEGVKRVKEWLEGLLPPDEREEEDGGTAPDGKETSVIVNQLACKEVGCPDVEVVITLLRAKPRPKLMFKIYKASQELTEEEIKAELNKALAEERGESVSHGHEHDEGAKKEHGHDEHGHDEHAGGGCCHDDCGHDHGHADHDAGHDQGHNEHGHDESKKHKTEHNHSE